MMLLVAQDRASPCVNWSPVLATEGAGARGTKEEEPAGRWARTTPGQVHPQPSPIPFHLGCCVNSRVVWAVCVVTRQTAWVKHLTWCRRGPGLSPAVRSGSPPSMVAQKLWPSAVHSWDFSGSFHPMTFSSLTARRGGDYVITHLLLRIFLEIPPAAALCTPGVASPTFPGLSPHPVLSMFPLSICQGCFQVGPPSFSPLVISCSVPFSQYFSLSPLIISLFPSVSLSEARELRAREGREAEVCVV